MDGILKKTPGEEETITPEEYRKMTAERERLYVRLSCGNVEVRPPPLWAYMELYDLLGVDLSRLRGKEALPDNASWEALGVDEKTVLANIEKIEEIMGTSITVRPRVRRPPGPGEERDPKVLYWDELLEEDRAALYAAATILQREVMGRKFLAGEPGGAGAGDAGGAVRKDAE